ncbi:MAG: hypothetical protein MUC81_09315 [Bacteroidia bacterium]|jgi:hypothetical protein|nr:hypothetical protein [Bacteroidia bacterium]
MEKKSIKKIQEKLNNLHDLPKGYEPDLQAKWDILQTALHHKKSGVKKRGLVFWWQIAAACLLFGGAGLLWFKYYQSHQPKTIAKVTKASAPVVNQKVTVAKPAKKKGSIRYKSAKHPTRIQLPIIQEKDTVISIAKVDLPEPKAAEIKDSLPPVVVAKATTERFIELDYNKPLVKDTAPNQIFIQAKKYRFNVGFGDKQQAKSGRKNFLKIRSIF